MTLPKTVHTATAQDFHRLTLGSRWLQTHGRSISPAAHRPATFQASKSKGVYASARAAGQHPQTHPGQQMAARSRVQRLWQRVQQLQPRRPQAHWVSVHQHAQRTHIPKRCPAHSGIQQRGITEGLICSRLVGPIVQKHIEEEEVRSCGG
eukprot:1141402-Pelagomonas_calceolata.AAC.4